MIALRGLLILFGYQWLGELLQRLVGVPLPGPVIGMLLLFATLMWIGDVPRSLGETSQKLIEHLSLLFLPAAVGFFYLGPQFADQWPAILGAIILGTALTLAVTGPLLQRLIRREAP